ncbi:hypothetical protein [Lysinibacillus sp. NPDC093692]|uniref:hypothetical protein n=1 Tax=Lysinibacillus sp. NPDC093692 TaxID=3390578 RepID=UPI003D065CF3
MRRYFGWKGLSLIIKLESINDLEVLLHNTNDMCKQQYETLVKLAEEIEDEEAKQQFYDFSSDNFILYEDTLPRINKYSILINLWTHLEYSVFQLANEAISELRLNAVNVRGQGFNDYLNFLRDNVEKNLVSSEKEEEIEILRVIRNRIVHSNGFVDRENKAKQQVDAIKYVESNELLSFSEDDRIIMSNYFVEECLDLASEIIEEIHNEIYKSGE